MDAWGDSVVGSAAMRQRGMVAAGLSILILVGLSLPGASAGDTVRFTVLVDDVRAALP
jgi:hypothetical protein